MSGYVLSFRARYAEAILSGAKRQTIRAPRRDGRLAKPGDTVHLFTGMRTKSCRRLGQGVVTDCFPVVIDFRVPLCIISNGVRLNPGEADAFARLDGFMDALDMIGWFFDVHGPEVFSGHCIRWSSREPVKHG